MLSVALLAQCNQLQLKKKYISLISANCDIIASGYFNKEVSGFTGFITSRAFPHLFADIGESHRWFIPAKVKVLGTRTGFFFLHKMENVKQMSSLFLEGRE